MEYVLSSKVNLGLPRLESTRRQSLGAGESLRISEADAELLRERFSMRRLLACGDVVIDRVRTREAPEPNPPQQPAERTEADPWNLGHKSRDELREIARELGLADKVDLRLGEERLREALREAIEGEG